jgi:predicted Zn finger-like uncharacterized protein
MFTRCTTCNTWFRLDQDTIRAAHGEVRCGACGARFNALATLSDTLPADAFANAPREVDDPAAHAPAGTPAPPSPDERLEEDWAEFGASPAAGEPVGLEQHEQDGGGTLSEEEEEQGSAGFVSQDDESGEPTRTGPDAGPFLLKDGEPLAEPPPAIVTEPGEALEPAAAPEPDSEDNGAYFAAEETDGAAAASADSPAEDAEAAPPDNRAQWWRRVPRWAFWTAGAIILLLVLISQILVYDRADLRANPVTRSPVQALYSAFGHPLPPRSDVDALAISGASVGVVPGASSKLKVVATLVNKADFAQSWPLIKLTLTDRFGETVAQGLYGSSHYLPAKTSDDNTIPAHASRQVRLEVADPGNRAVGFVVVPCVSSENGTKCAARHAQR